MKPVASGGRGAGARIRLNYALGLAYSRITAAVAVSLVIVSLARNTGGDARMLLTEKSLIALVVLTAISAIVDAVAGALIILPTYRWFARGQEPTPAQQRAAMRIPNRQTVIQFAVWVLAGIVFALLNLDIGFRMAWLVGATTLFGALTTSCMAYLVTQRALRPIIAAAMKNSTAEVELPGVLGRLIFIWVLFSALPALGIAVIVLARANGWFVDRSAPIETPILVLVGLSLLLGVRAMVLVARSISDPVGEVVVAMKGVEEGRFDESVDIYEPSEIGQLQSGFNQMVAGLAERERMRDLFGRYVGVDVARHALENNAALSGDEREAAILFVDLVGSTAMAASRPPQEVARILDDFFRAVVSTVEARDGLINKFGGDAVLAVFGAPLRLDEPATAALATARELAAELTRLPVDFGVGVSCGSVFAGTVGAENRYEYTVIGDAVNEAARLADLAKDRDCRVLASGRALTSAVAAEQECWKSRGSTVLRGRSTRTDLAEPVQLLK